MKQDALYAEHARYLWGLSYRLTGSAADADDVVQETFVRAMTARPDDTLPMRPWLTRVAVNLGRDVLRRRRRTPYVGPWLPSPVPLADEPTIDAPQARYDLAESATFAFLLALEALSPPQRAVLILRDVLDWSVRETAELLAMSETNVKVTLHRARAKMADHDAKRVDPRAVADRTREALTAFVTALMAGDEAAVVRLLAADVRALSDGGGEFHAARKPVLGPDAVARMYLGLVRSRGADATGEVVTLNALPALVARFPNPRPNEGPMNVLAVRLDRGGKIAEVYSVLASRKLTALRGAA